MDGVGRRAVVLLSGGLDSATVLAVAKAQGFAVYALTIGYGQRHHVERQAAERVAAAMGVVRHQFLEIDLSAFGGSALTDTRIDVPKDRLESEMTTGIPITYVPARNTVFLSLALAWAETLDCFDVFVGVNCVDYSGYPDCRPEYLRAFEAMADKATRAGVEGRGRFTIHAPFLHATKRDIVERGLELGVNYAITHSCYDPDASGRACGHCDSCLIRRKAFADLGMTDPAPYQDGHHPAG